MKKDKVAVGKDILVIHNGIRTNAKVRRIGESHGVWHMLTLDIAGQTAYVPCHTSELSYG